MYVRAFAVTPGLKHRFTGRQLVELGTAIGDEAIVELTPFQQLLVQMEGSHAEVACSTLLASGMMTYAVGAVVKNVRACSFCQGDEVEGLEAATALDTSVAGLPVPAPVQVAYSGCPTGCSEPLLYDIGVVKVGDGFDVYAGGYASGMSPRPGKMVAHGLPESKMPTAVRRILLFYQEAGWGRERFCQFVDRVGLAAITKSMVRFGRVRRNRPPGA